MGFVALLGKSGSGKSTLLNLLSMQEKPSSGSIYIGKKKLSSLNQKEKEDIRNLHFGFVYQHYNLIESLSVLENIMLPILLFGEAKGKALRKAKKLLASFKMLELANRECKNLSGGEKQRVSILRALANDPDVIFADEPTGALDNENGKKVMETLKRISKDRLVIMVSHNEPLVSSYKDYLIRLDKGEIKETDLSPINKKKWKIAKRGKRNDWSNLILNLHLKENKKKNFLSLLASSITYLTILLSLGFFIGGSNLEKESVKDNLLRYSASISKKEVVTLEDSPLSLLKVTRPLKEEMEALLNKDITYRLDYSYFFPKRNTYLYQNEEKREISLNPLLDETFLSLSPSLIKEGRYDGDYLSCLCNQEFADLYDSPIGETLTFSNEITLLVDGIRESIPLSISFRISGIIEEFPFLNEPRIYYLYDSVYALLENTFLNNKKSLIELILEANGDEAISSFSYLVFALNEEGFNSFSSFLNLEGYSFSSTYLQIKDSFLNIHKAVSLSLSPFLILELAIIAFIVGSIAFSSFLERKKEAAILNALGARRKQIIFTYVKEGMILSSLGMVIALLISYPAEYLLNLFLLKEVGFKNLIQIPYLSFLGIPFLLIILSLLFASLLGFLGTRIPLQSLYSYPLSEALRDE